MTRLCVGRNAAITLVIGLLVPMVRAQTATRWLGEDPVDPHNWFNARNWSTGVPDANTDATVDAAARIPYPVVNGQTAWTRLLVVGRDGTGGVSVGADGRLHVSGEAAIGAYPGSLGLVTIRDNGRMITDRLAAVGLRGNGSVQMTGESRWSLSDHVVIGADAGSTGEIELNDDAGFVSRQDVIIGFRDGATGRFLLRGNSIAVVRDLYVGMLSEGRRQTQGEVHLHDRSGLYVTGNGSIGAVPGRGVSRASVVLHGRNAGVHDLSRRGDASLIVNGSQARLYGAGTYDIRVFYDSDRNFGTFNNQPVSVVFPRNTLQVGAAHDIRAGLAPWNVGWGPPPWFLHQVDRLRRQSLPNTAFNISWSAGAPGFAADVTYDTNVGTPQVWVPFNPADVTGSRVVPARNVLPRVSLLQFGPTLRTGNAQSPAGDYYALVRNITSRVDAPLGLVFGKSENVQGDFDVAVMGKAVMPRHQIPAIRTLHERYGLMGRGVRFGQIELSTPYLEHGAFDDWSRPEGLRASVLGQAWMDAHPTRVASIMIGYDPLGIQVNGLSRFEWSSVGINEGFGYTGVAPMGTLVSTRAEINPQSKRLLYGEAMERLVGMRQDARPVVVNISVGESGGSDGTSIDALMIDHYVTSSGIILTQAAGNEGWNPSKGVVYGSLSDPAGAYNIIAVGNAQFDNPWYPTRFTIAAASVEPSSSRGPTNDERGRSAPHLVAMGTGNYTAYLMERKRQGQNGRPFSEIDPAFPVEGNRRLYSTQKRNHDPRGAGVVPSPVEPVAGTSFAAPTVAGVAGLMWERAERFGDEQVRQKARDPRTIKSILMTTAEKPATWTRGQPGVTGANDTKVPLSYDWGAGLLSPVNAMDLLDRGFKPSGLAHTHTGKGWGFDRVDEGMTSRIAGENRQGIFYVLQTPQNGTPFTATLNWYRHVTGPGGGSPFTATPPANLDLELYEWDRANTFTRIAISDAVHDNLEHIYLKAAPRLAEGWVWVLRVLSTGVARGTPETFAVSWAYMAVPSPAALALLAAAGVLSLARRRR
jgi:hypothetical protein